MATSTMTSSKSNSSHTQVVDRMKVLYHADHQERFLSLQAETETLLHQLQARKAQRLETPITEVYPTSFRV